MAWLLVMAWLSVMAWLLLRPGYYWGPAITEAWLLLRPWLLLVRILVIISAGPGYMGIYAGFDQGHGKAV